MKREVCWDVTEIRRKRTNYSTAQSLATMIKRRRFQYLTMVSTFDVLGAESMGM